ncbi:MAG: PDZ domain-containing protein [Chloroflexi bacterium]|nr:PDZ domain-containing protein [Chloroflexota bacterium]
MEIAIYTTPTCPYCRMLKDLLSEKGIPFREYDVSRDRAAAEDIAKRTGQTAVPVTVIDGQTIIGFDRVRLEQALAERQQHVPRPAFGATIADASKITARLGSPVTFGAYVGSVRPGSVAGRAGLMKGDIVTELNMRPIANASDLEAALSKLDSGSHFWLVFLRGNKTVKTEGTF